MSYSEIIKKEIGIYNKARLRIIERAAKELFKNFDKIDNKEKFEKYIKPFHGITNKNKKNDIQEYRRIVQKINFEILEMIYSAGRVGDKNWDKKEENLRKLLYLNRDEDFKKPWQRILSNTIINMIMGNHGNIKTEITSAEDHITLIESWQSVGMQLDWTNIADRVEQKMLDITVVEERMAFKEIATPVLSALDKYANLFDQVKYPHKSFSKKEIKTRLEKRSKRERFILEGMHMKDYIMASLYKKLNEYRCEKEGDCEGEIQVKHIIPLKYGVKLGGIDTLENYKILCSKHHYEFETPLIDTLDAMKSDYERLDHLKELFPEIIKVSLGM